MELLKVWTIQSLEAWIRMEKKGVLTASKKWIAEDDLESYTWMRQQMVERIPGCRGGWPLWLWVRWCTKSARPDLRSSGHLPQGMKGVMLELEVPRQDVLISDFDMWHHVLNSAYLAWSESEQDEREQRESSADVTDKVLEEEKKKSWERIFNLTSPREEEWVGDPSKAPLQGCIEAIYLHQVTQITHFTALGEVD